MKSHQAYLAGSGKNELALRLLASIEDTQLAGVDACADWLRAMPDSYAAHWVCGAMWQKGAWVARGGKFASEVGAARFALMYERLARSSALLDRAIQLTPQPVEALAVRGSNEYLGGDEKTAAALLQRAAAFAPRDESVFDARLNHALPEWGGSEAQVEAVLAQAKQAGIEKDTLLDWHDRYLARPGKLSTPGAARAYWQQVVGEHPTRKRLIGLRDDFIRLENWREALPVASRLIVAYPGYGGAYYWRARTYEGLGRMAEARADYYTAALMGHDLAAQALIMANIRGGLGITERSFDSVLRLCRHGAALGSGVGANCIGSLFSEGGGEGIPHRNDPAQSLAWHQVGARAGHYNSQYDLGWMLFSGRGEGVKQPLARDAGVFWLRRAAEQNHQYAKRKLEEAGISLAESSQPEDGFGIQSGIAALSARMQGIF
jgi:TPR repeat protein